MLTYPRVHVHVDDIWNITNAFCLSSVGKLIGKDLWTCCLVGKQLSQDQTQYMHGVLSLNILIGQTEWA